jgi:murein DD-endopeptidase MepM/ murein hydrolase activator NlpD
MQDYGKMVHVSHGYGMATRYGHLSEILVRPGQRVRRGEVIGRVGSTGRSTGPHLHYEVFKAGRRVDPRRYLGDKNF